MTFLYMAPLLFVIAIAVHSSKCEVNQPMAKSMESVEAIGQHLSLISGQQHQGKKIYGTSYGQQHSYGQGNANGYGHHGGYYGQPSSLCHYPAYDHCQKLALVYKIKKQVATALENARNACKNVEVLLNVQKLVKTVLQDGCHSKGGSSKSKSQLHHPEVKVLA